MALMQAARAPRHPLAGALWANALALALIALALIARGDSGAVGTNEGLTLPAVLPAAHAQGVPIAGGGGLYLMPGQLASNIWGVYIMDVDRQSLMAYQFDPAAKRLNFVAARELTHDRLLGNYNTFPDPLEIKSIADKERQNTRLPAGGE